MKRLVSLLLFASLSLALVSTTFVSPVSSQTIGLLNPLSIPKWVNQINGPLPVFLPTNVTNANGKIIRQDYVVNITQFYQQILPTVDSNGNPTGFGETKVWGYGGIAYDPVTGQNLGYIESTPGPTFEATRNIPSQVEWVNDLVDSSGKPLPELFPVDPTIMWANPNNINMTEAQIQAGEGLAPPFPPGYNGSSYTLPNGQIANPDQWNAQSPVAVVTHLHGGEDPSADDGGPDAWYTPNGIHGPTYNTAVPTTPNAAVYQYPNSQEPTTLWYHDHTLGVTRLHVYAGLSGLYIINDPSDPVDAELPSAQFDIPLVIQDRSFYTNGQLFYPTEGDNPQISPYVVDSFLGNTIMVDGKVWPNMNVKQGEYYFRILDGSNDRFYNFSFSNGMSFTQIGSDGGYLKAPVQLTSLLIGPAERAGILVDFSNLTLGTKIILQNSALTGNITLEKETVGQVMQFTVTGGEGFAPKPLPSVLNPTLAGAWPTLPNPTKTLIFTLTGTSGTNDSMPMYLDGQTWTAPPVKVVVGTTEDWVFVNPTDVEHQMHVHLIQFQIVQRQAFNVTAYMAEWTALNGKPPLDHPTINVPSLDPYLIGPPIPPAPNEQGWKDTVQVYPGEVTTIRIRFAQQDGTPFPFDATVGPGYVFHCHLLEHEDDDMMRAYILIKPTQNINLEVILIGVIILLVAAILILLIFRRGKLRAATPEELICPFQRQ
jgi:FtsP/CotA-like multicopper oxidase with cupredoxin domain